MKNVIFVSILWLKTVGCTFGDNDVMKNIEKNSGDLYEISLIYNITQECPKTCKKLVYHEKILNDTKSKIEQLKKVRNFHLQ